MPHSIFAIAGNNGVISHEGLNTWDPEFQPTYTVTPDAGYELADLRINNESVVVANNSYTFPTLTANATIRAIFQPKAGHSLWGMGENEQGQLATGNLKWQNYPYRMVDQSVTAVAMGTEHCLWLRSDGILWGAGSNVAGQLGLNPINCPLLTPNPTQLRASDVVAIAAGSYHSLLLQPDGTLWAMGKNDRGQLGIGNTVNQYAPVQVPTTAPVVAISAGDAHSMILLDDGTLWVMGANDRGQLGVGDTVDRTSPCQVPVPGNQPVRLITAGFDHSLFSDMTGKTYGMGSNLFGQLGNGGEDKLPHPVPQWVAAEGGMVIKVHAATGGYSSAFLFVDPKSGITLRTAGNNSCGQLALSPFTVPGQSPQGVDRPTMVMWSDVESLAIGHAECLAIKTDGSLWGIGQNAWGLLGIGTKKNLTTPLKVFEDVFKVVISARNSGLLGTEIPSSTCVITARAGAHGSVSPAGSSGRSIFNFGATPTYTFTPAAGYHVANVWVDGKSYGATPALEFPPLAANHQIVVEFAQTMYTITATAGAGGRIAPAGASVVPAGTKPTYTITPDAGYKLSELKVNGTVVTVGADGSYTFPAVQADQTIAGTFSLAAFPLNGTQYLTGAALVNVPGPYTISGWCQGSTGGLYTQGDGSNGAFSGAVARVWLSDSILNFANDLATSQTEVCFSLTSPFAAGLHHFAATFDGTTAMLYLDGKLVVSKAAKGTPHDGDPTCAIGRCYLNEGYLNGDIAYFGFANQVLTATQITALYNTGTPLAWAAMNDTQQALFAHFYNFVGDVGITFSDHAGTAELTLQIKP